MQAIRTGNFINKFNAITGTFTDWMIQNPLIIYDCNFILQRNFRCSLWIVDKMRSSCSTKNIHTIQMIWLCIEYFHRYNVGIREPQNMNEQSYCSKSLHLLFLLQKIFPFYNKWAHKIHQIRDIFKSEWKAIRAIFQFHRITDSTTIYLNKYDYTNCIYIDTFWFFFWFFFLMIHWKCFIPLWH